jgi:hypothetical protein
MAFPSYDFASELKTPNQLGVNRGGGWDQIGSAIAGVNYYMDSAAFGEATGFAKMWGGQFSQQTPLGVHFFAKTGRTCANGEPMYEYISTIPKGDILGQRIKNEVAGIGLPQMRGLALGAMEDARDALNPAPFFSALGGTDEKPKCRKLRARVGDANGRLASSNNPNNVWITGETQRDAQGMPTQEFWVKEGFSTQEPKFTYPWIAGALLGVLAIGILSLKQK